MKTSEETYNEVCKIVLGTYSNDPDASRIIAEAELTKYLKNYSQESALKNIEILEYDITIKRDSKIAELKESQSMENWDGWDSYYNGMQQALAELKQEITK